MTRAGRHRVFVVPTRGDVPLRQAVDHWEGTHGPIFAATPHLDGYVQHRPTWADQQRLGGRVCAEAWFADREAERRAFTSDHYRGAVTEDEDRFVDRATAWTALVVEEAQVGDAATSPRTDQGGRMAQLSTTWAIHPPHGSEVEVVAVGCDPAGLPDGVAARVLTTDRPGPAGGPAAVVIVAVADEAAGRELLDGLVADEGFVARRAAVKPPPAG